MAIMKIRAYTLLTFAALLPAMQGCSEEERDTEPVPVSFAPATATRAGAMTTNTMGVLAYHTVGVFEANVATATPNYMYNQLVTENADGTVWEYSPLMYWPAYADAEKISFFAYAPHNSVTASSPTAEGYPSLAFALPADETTAPIDLLAASQIDCTYADGAVHLSFKHALTKIRFVIKNADSDGTMKTVTELSLTSYQSGTLNYTADGINWTQGSNQRVYKFIASPLSVGSNYGAEADAGSTLTIPDKTGVTLSFGYTMTIDGVEKTVVQTDVALPVTPEWTPGSVITYAIWLKQEEEATIVAVSNSAWSNSGDDEIITIE